MAGTNYACEANHVRLRLAVCPGSFKRGYSFPDLEPRIAYVAGRTPVPLTLPAWGQNCRQSGARLSMSPFDEALENVSQARRYDPCIAEELKTGRFVSWAAGILFLFLVIGCGNPSERWLIGVVSKGQAHKFWQSIHAGVNAAGEEFDVEILWNGPTQDTDYSRQIQIIDAMVTRGVDALAVAPVDRTAIVPPIERAVSQGIPVTIYDSALDFDGYTTFAATNNADGGRMAARKLAELLGGKGRIIVLMHMPGSAASMEREAAFDETISEEYPEIQIVGAQYGMGNRAKVMAVAENLLTAHPNIDGLFASTEAGAVGAARALKSRELDGKVKFVAFDASDEMVEDLRAGTIHALVAQDPFRIGYEAVKSLAMRLAGESPPREIDLSPRMIMSEDLHDPEVQTLLFPDLERHLK